MEFEALLYDVRGHVAVVTLNRPAALNAISVRLADELEAALDLAEGDAEVRVIVLTGAGDRAFCAGADLKEMAAGAARRPNTERGGFAGFVQRDVVKPVIAAVNGLAHGGGTEIALACDLVVAAEEATFALPEVRRGFAAGSAGGLLRLPRQIPLKIAMELALTGEPMPAPEAGRWGLANRVVPRRQVLPTAIELAETIAANAPLAVEASKSIMYRGLDAPLGRGPTAWEVALGPTRRLSDTEDAREGPRAFAEKRQPVWKGR